MLETGTGAQGREACLSCPPNNLERTVETPKWTSRYAPNRRCANEDSRNFGIDLVGWCPTNLWCRTTGKTDGIINDPTDRNLRLESHHSIADYCDPRFRRLFEGGQQRPTLGRCYFRYAINLPNRVTDLAASVWSRLDLQVERDSRAARLTSKAPSAQWESMVCAMAIAPSFPRARAAATDPHAGHDLQRPESK
jgi:hypothetical protein